MRALLTFFFLLPLGLFAQNLSGIWKGSLGMGGGCFAVNNLEVQITMTGYELSGSDYQYESINHYVKKRIRGRFDPDTKRVELFEGDITTFHIHSHCQICVKNFHLVYTRNGNTELLTGEWEGHILNSAQRCSTGPITLTRTTESAFKEVPEILVDTGQLRLDFYDNAEVDGDSISVLVNKNVVVSHQRLSLKPVTTYLTIDSTHTFQEIEMVAENLGSIPPNTAMLIITAGDKKYQLYLTSTKQKSAMVRFVYEPPEPTRKP